MRIRFTIASPNGEQSVPGSHTLHTHVTESYEVISFCDTPDGAKPSGTLQFMVKATCQEVDCDKETTCKLWHVKVITPSEATAGRYAGPVILKDALRSHDVLGRWESTLRTYWYDHTRSISPSGEDG